MYDVVMARPVEVDMSSDSRSIADGDKALESIDVMLPDNGESGAKT